jgi:HlyD family secretion protein
MKPSIYKILVLVTIIIHAGIGFQSSAAAVEKAPKKKADSNRTESAKKPSVDSTELAKPKIHKVGRKYFQVKVSLNGLFESSRMKEVSIPVQSWGELQVLDALPQGALVKKGESLVTLDLKKIDAKIRTSRHELAILDLDRKIAKADLKLAEIVFPLELATLERKNKETQEDLARHKSVHRPFNEKAAAFSLKASQESLSYAEEELRQLKKMYEADDLTEETEEIILQRAENSVERSKFSLEAAKIRNEQTLRFEFPRDDLQIKEAAKRNELTLQTTRKIRPAELEKKRLEVIKLDRLHDQAMENLARLEQDRKTMTVPSPAAGIVYRGSFDRGKWSGSSPFQNRLRRGGALKPHEIFMTVVSPQPMFVRAMVDEKDLRLIKKGSQGKVLTMAYPNLKMKGTIREISSTPVAPGKYDVILDIDLPKEKEMVTPKLGMACKFEIVGYRNEKAIVIPLSMIFTEEKDSDSQYVYLHRKNKKKEEKRKVVTGERSGDEIEILEGLKHGLEILAQKPKK